MCHVAVVQHALQKSDKALQTLNAAIKIAPKNPLCKFERASILHSSEKYGDALMELNDLKDIVPKESSIYFLLGKVLQMANNGFFFRYLLMKGPLIGVNFVMSKKRRF